MQNKTKTIPPARSGVAIVLTGIGVISILAALVFWPMAPLTDMVMLVVAGFILIGFASLIAGVRRLIHEVCWLGARLDGALPMSDQQAPTASPAQTPESPHGLT